MVITPTKDERVRLIKTILLLACAPIGSFVDFRMSVECSEDDKHLSSACADLRADMIHIARFRTEYLNRV
jgi:hypothetical protein